MKITLVIFLQLILNLKYTTIFFDESLRDFFLADFLRQEIEQTFQGKIFALKNPTYEAHKMYLERKKEELDA